MSRGSVLKTVEYGAILIDLAGAREATVLKAIARSDLVIMPMKGVPDLVFVFTQVKPLVM